jgi:hypothetical protein
VGQRAKVTAGVGESRNTVADEWHAPEGRMLHEEGFDDVLVFFGLARASGIHEASTRPQRDCGLVQETALSLGERLQVVCPAPPPDIGVTADRSKS